MAWEEDFLEHLRLVHFSVLTTSVALLIAGALSPSGSLENAYEQARLLLAVRQEALRPQHVNQVTSSLSVAFLVDEKRFHVLGPAQELAAQVAEGIQARLAPSRPISLGWSWGSNMRTKGNLHHILFVSELPQFRPQTLAEFRDAWNFFWSGKAVEAEGVDWDNVRYFSGGKRLKVSTATASISEDMDMKLSLRVEVDPSRNFVRPQWFIVAELRSARSGSEIDEVHVPIAARKRFDVDFQSALLVRPEFALVRGSFSEAFGDLEAIAIGLDTLEIEPLVAYARSRYRQDEERIQILGVAIPQGVIGQWGLALLLGCQGYLVLHLRKFLGMSFTEDILQRFAWIVLYRDKVSSTVSLTTVAVFPALAACILVGNVWNATPSVAVRAVLSVELVFAFALAIASGLLVARINRRGSSAAAKS